MSKEDESDSFIVKKQFQESALSKNSNLNISIYEELFIKIKELVSKNFFVLLFIIFQLYKNFSYDQQLKSLTTKMKEIDLTSSLNEDKIIIIDNTIKNMNTDINNKITVLSKFHTTELLNYFNKKYNLSINKESTSISLENIENPDISIFVSFANLFKNLKELTIFGGYDGVVNDLSFLLQENMNNLEILKLYSNKINNLNNLSGIKLNNLNTLNLRNNDIYNIDILGKNFPKLEKLYLGANQISSIKIFHKSLFNDLKVLDLWNNQIEDINSLKEKFPLLEILDFGVNKISDISVLANATFNKLKSLSLDSNNIIDIDSLKNKFPEIEKLNLCNNRIRNISAISRNSWDKLKELDLSYNPIRNINDLLEANYGQLEKLYLIGNRIYNKDKFVKAINETKHFPNLKYLYLVDYNVNALK